jgi:hypothetical protein
MWWPEYPAHVVGPKGEIPTQEPFPQSCPMSYVRRECPGIMFVEMSRGFYCMEHVCGMKKL